ncbi:unnamed protein product [Paramecium pentaurelia]|uniref:Uncharacterized protein n=1 Tax=Paramecium pentaurelia TaxID=43138 RepID=A0A8S1S6F6_9CILI|nr:unnamed protein product [Paramecium pentaurelia]
MLFELLQKTYKSLEKIVNVLVVITYANIVKRERKIYAVQPSFVLTNENAKYIMKCIKLFEDHYIIINPYQSILKYYLYEIC